MIVSKSIRTAILALSVVSAFSLTACSGLGTDNTPKPLPLTKIQPQLWPVQTWNKSIGSGVDSDYLLLGPVVSGNTIFTANRDGKLVATNGASGKEMWTYNSKTTLTSSPAVNGNLLVIGSADGKLFALDSTTGKQLWQTTLSDQILASPQIAQGYVIVKTIDGKVVALSAQDGHTLWTYNHGSPTLILRGGSQPLVIGATVVSGFADGKLAAFNLNDGHLLWEQVIAEPVGAAAAQQMVDIVADPRLGEGVVYVATYQGKLSAINLRTGQALWQQNISSYTGLVLGPQLIFITDATGNISAFDRAHGDLVWQQIGLRYRQLTTPVLMNNTVVVADVEGVVHWLSQADGHVMGRTFIGKKKPIIAAPVVMDNTVIAVSTNGTLAAWQVSDSLAQAKLPTVFSSLIK